MNPEYQTIANKITAMATIDQKIRNSKDINWSQIRKVDEKHRHQIKIIIEEFGLTDISRFGKKAADAAWLLIQHFPKKELKFMKEYLSKMKAKPNDINPKNIAYLEDRINMYMGKPQIYGTQMITDKKNDTLQFYPIKDLKNINSLRKRAGLSTLEEYKKEMK